MKTYEINIAKAYTMSDWRGNPAHRHFASITLDDTLGEAEAVVELERLTGVYPWPEFHLSLTRLEEIKRSESMASSAPADFLQAHQWPYRSIHAD